MGVRIYPNTTDSSILEVLAGVPQGTMARLNQTREKHQQILADARERGEDTMEVDYQNWKEINDDPHMAPLDDLRVFGWGKFTHEAFQVLKSNPDKWEGEDYDGSSKDTAFIEQLLEAQGVFLGGLQVEKLEGISWG